MEAPSGHETHDLQHPPLPTTELATSVNNFVRQYFMFIIVGIGVCYLLFQRISHLWEDFSSRKLHVQAKRPEQEKSAALQAAREKQQLYMDECTKRDEEAREAKKAREAEERAKQLDLHQGRRLGDGDDENDKKKDLTRSDFMDALPRLRGGPDRDRYRPSFTRDTGNGYYRPTGFQRPAGG